MCTKKEQNNITNVNVNKNNCSNLSFFDSNSNYTMLLNYKNISFSGSKNRKNLIEKADKFLDNFNDCFEDVGRWTSENLSFTPSSPRAEKTRSVVNKYTASNAAISATVGQVPYLDAPILARNEAKMIKEIEDIYWVANKDSTKGAVAGTVIGVSSLSTVENTLKEAVGSITGIGSIAKSCTSAGTTKSVGEWAIKRARAKAQK